MSNERTATTSTCCCFCCCKPLFSAALIFFSFYLLRSRSLMCFLLILMVYRCRLRDLPFVICVRMQRKKIAIVRFRYPLSHYYKQLCSIQGLYICIFIPRTSKTLSCTDTETRLSNILLTSYTHMTLSLVYSYFVISDISLSRLIEKSTSFCCTLDYTYVNP